MIFGSRCRRFSYLLNEGEDRSLHADEMEFLDRHETDCQKCAALRASANGLNMLRACALEPQVDPGFDERVVRLVRVQRGRGSISYWSPALIGAAVACLAILAALQMIAKPSQLPTFNGSNADARLLKPHAPAFPTTNLAPTTRDQ